MGFSAKDLGIDLGTANTIIYNPEAGVILNEATAIAYDKYTGEIIATGTKAKAMYGKAPRNIEVIKPLQDGVISDFDMTAEMLQIFIRQATEERKPAGLRVVVGVPSGVTEVEKRAVREAAAQAGGKDVFLMEEPLAAAIGADIDISRPEGTFVIDIGGGTSDIAVISLGGIVASTSLKVAGDRMDEAIVKYMRKKHKLYIGERMAETLKKEIGTAFPRPEEVSYTCSGRDLVTGLPREVEVTSSEMMEALEEPLQQICEATHSVLEKTPPELAADISTGGIIITGGGALLYGIDERIKQRTGINVKIAENPMDCVAIGTGRALENIDVLQKSAINRRRRFK